MNEKLMIKYEIGIEKMNEFEFQKENNFINIKMSIKIRLLPGK